MLFHDAVGINCKKGATTENLGAGVKYMGVGVCWLLASVIALNMTTHPRWRENLVVYFYYFTLTVIIIAQFSILFILYSQLNFNYTLPDCNLLVICLDLRVHRSPRDRSGPRQEGAECRCIQPLQAHLPQHSSGQG